MNRKHFFGGVSSSIILPALKVVQSKGLQIRRFIQQAVGSFGLILGQSNHPDRVHTQMVEWGVIPPFDYFFAGSKTGAETIARNWVLKDPKESLEDQTVYIWDSPIMWRKLFKLLDANKDKRILLMSSDSCREHGRLKKYPNVLFSSPSPKLVTRFEGDKRRMTQLYRSLHLKYDALNYASSEAVLSGYGFHSQELRSKILVIQASQGSGGLTMRGYTQSLFFVSNEKEFQVALKALRGEGPLRIMKKYEGIPSNSAALALPFGTFISGIPTVKPCGLVELGARPGASGGNQWDMRFPESVVSSQFGQLNMVGRKMAEVGFCGVFGLDPIMPLDSGREVFNSEINARSQGPDPQRAWAAHSVGISSLEELQMAFYLGCPTELFPEADDYNLVTRWLRIPPYLKLFPKRDRVVRRDFNGYWRWKAGLVKAPRTNASFRITGAPSVGQKILKESLDYVLCVRFLDVDMKIYTQDTEPGLTPLALQIVNYLYANI